MTKTLVKTKIVHSKGDNGSSITIYFWRKIVWFIGYYYPFGTVSSTADMPTEMLEKINDENASKVFYDTFIAGGRINEQ